MGGQELRLGGKRLKQHVGPPVAAFAVRSRGPVAGHGAEEREQEHMVVSLVYEVVVGGRVEQDLLQGILDGWGICGGNGAVQDCEPLLRARQPRGAVEELTHVELSNLKVGDVEPTPHPAIVGIPVSLVVTYPAW